MLKNMSITGEFVSTSIDIALNGKRLGYNQTSKKINKQLEISGVQI